MKRLHLTPIALAVAALFMSPLALADRDHHDREGASLSKKISLEEDIDIKGDVHVFGMIMLDSSAMAVVDDKQVNVGNAPVGERGANNGAMTTNTASATDNALQGATGNIGLNIAAGDSNQQANAAALAATDARFVFGAADAEIFAGQLVMANLTPNVGKTNLATLHGNVLQDASGNIGVNVAAGNNNQQKNDLAAASAVSRSSTATVSVDQANLGNRTTNAPFDDIMWTSSAGGARISLSGTYSGGGWGGYNGWEGGSYSGSTQSTSSGTSVQSNDYYPEVWTSSSDPNHPCSNCSQTGHIDMDSGSPGAVGHGLAFNNTGNSSGSEQGGYGGYEYGSLGFQEAGDIALSGSASWWSFTAQRVWVPTTNTASLSGNVLQRASGNIGVNIAAGTNNQQYNGLAISAASSRE